MHTAVVIDDLAHGYPPIAAEMGLPDLTVLAATNEQEAESLLPKADIVLTGPGTVKKLEQKAPHIDWAMTLYVGVETLTFDRTELYPFTITQPKGVFGPQMAEYAMIHFGIIRRKSNQVYRWQKEHFWTARHGEGRIGGLGRTLGVLGYGSIGQEVGRKAKAYDMNVHACVRTPKDQLPLHADRLFTVDHIDEFMDSIDDLVMVVPYTKESRQLLRGHHLGRLKDGAIFLSMGRGKTVHQEEMTDFLKDRPNVSAVLDVFEQEPLPDDNPLWDMPNVIVTSHNAGLRSYPETVMPVFAANYRRLVSGEPLDGVIDIERGY